MSEKFRWSSKTDSVCSTKKWKAENEDTYF